MGRDARDAGDRNCGRFNLSVQHREDLPVRTALLSSFRDPAGAFVSHAPYGVYRGEPGDGSLAGARLAVKDLFDVSGLRTGAGSPAWLAKAAIATQTAPAVSTLVEAGASFVGKTITDELAWSLNGENVHDGTPANPAAPGRIPGGSSAGSASAVAAGMADVALGTDTGGSIRLPASYCGLWGLRPTHGRISTEGVVPLAPSYDCVGVLTRSAEMLRNSVSLMIRSRPSRVRELVLATDLMARVDEPYRAGLVGQAERLARILDLPLRRARLADGALPEWRETFRVAQAAEVWATHGDWVSRTRPAFGPGIAERFAMASELSAAQITEARAQRVWIAQKMHDAVAGGTVLIVPGAAGPPPVRGLAARPLDDIRTRALEILCPAGHAGLPQLAIPALTTSEGPVGLGLIAGADEDATLLQLGVRLEAASNLAEVAP